MNWLLLIGCLYLLGSVVVIARALIDACVFYRKIRESFGLGEHVFARGLLALFWPLSMITWHGRSFLFYRTFGIGDLP